MWFGDKVSAPVPADTGLKGLGTHWEDLPRQRRGVAPWAGFVLKVLLLAASLGSADSFVTTKSALGAPWLHGHARGLRGKMASGGPNGRGGARGAPRGLGGTFTNTWNGQVASW